MSECVPAGVRGDGVFCVRNQSDLVRNDFQDKIHERLYRVALYVELCGNQWPDLPYVRVSDVSFIRTWVHCDAFSSEFLAVDCCKSYVRHAASACVPDGGNLVYVDAESGHDVMVSLFTLQK